jgi:hypothetical protein
MLRNFLHIRWAQATILDRQGIELANIGEAVKEAVRAGEILRRWIFAKVLLTAAE